MYKRLTQRFAFSRHNVPPVQNMQFLALGIRSFSSYNAVQFQNDPSTSSTDTGKPSVIPSKVAGGNIKRKDRRSKGGASSKYTNIDEEDIQKEINSDRVQKAQTPNQEIDPNEFYTERDDDTPGGSDIHGRLDKDDMNASRK
mmetsp:Transcript_934/g.3215  ORF Transcript_934/g.3215 Transcript_934/m.3215 type:complete len:142 (-) Transcript_934:308-733(-)